MTVPRVSYCFFCDDIRQEIGGKTTLVGIYHGDIIFSAKPPVVYPKLCVNVVIISEPNDAPKSFSIKMLDPSGKEILRTDKIELSQIPPLPHNEGAQKAITNFGFQASPVKLDTEGFIEVWVKTEREKMRAGRLYVSFREPSATAGEEKVKTKRPAKKSHKRPRAKKKS